MKLSQRIQLLKTSPIRKLLPFAEAAQSKGVRIIHLNIGQPDIETPPLFMEAVKAFGDKEKVISYAHSAGSLELREGISQYFRRRGIEYNVNDIMITSGGSEAFQFIITSLFDIGDEVLLPEPFYANYNSYFAPLGVTVRTIPTRSEDGFHLPGFEEMEKYVTPKVKAIMFSTPCNPSGVIYTRDEMLRIIKLAEKYNLTIVSDEVYREFAYGERRAVSLGEFPEALHRSIIIDSISKRFSACGARIGCILAKDKDFLAAVFRQCQARLACPSLEMAGAAALYTLPDNFFDPIKKEYQHRRNVLFEEIENIPGAFTREPEGAFYCLVRLPVANAEDFAAWLLSEFSLDGETVMIAPAEGFYSTPGMGKNEARICYVLQEPALRKAMRILREGLKAYNSKK